MRQFAHIQNTPVIAKGAAYDGWTADALAAPAVCHNGTGFVMTVSFWNTAAQQWASGFFTSPDLVTWTYVVGSLQVPTGPDYILGNSGLAWWNNKYWFAFNHYPTDAPANGIAIWSSTDLLNWTVEESEIGPAYAADPQLSVNPDTDKLECLYINSARECGLLDTSNGTVWTDQGVIRTGPFWAVADFGECTLHYNASGCWMTHDGARVTGRRFIGLALSTDDKATWTGFGTCLALNINNAWENTNIFDSCPVGVYDLGDGPRLYLLYAGSDIVAATNDTSSSIGLAWMTDPTA